MNRLLSLVIIFAGSLACLAQDDQLPSGEDIGNTLQELVPEGWVVYEGAAQFDPDNMYEQINGRAIYYLSYDCAGLTFLGIEHEADANQYLDVSVFDMGLTVNAYGVYSSQRPSGIRPAVYGRESYEVDGHRYIWSGKYYAILVASDTSRAVQHVADQFAVRLSDILPDDGETIRGLDMLPRENRIPATDKYFKSAALGLDFLNEAYFADYRFEDEGVQLFVSEQKSEQEAVGVLKDFEAFANAYGESAEDVLDTGRAMIIADMGDTYDVFLASGPLVMGVFGVSTSERAVSAVTWLAKQVGNE